MSSKTENHAWLLEVVRGRDAGRIYALNGGEVVLGSAIGGDAGIDLADQEGTSPRRMAAKQAKLECEAGAVSLRDLDSPGGTFVNKQRVLPGQARPLQDGDLIQLGAVQLKVVARGNHQPPPPSDPKAQPSPAAAKPTTRPPAPPPSAPAPAPSSGRPQPLAFTLKDGPTCRSWDDFLTVSAQRWSSLRDELVSGRLAGYLNSIGSKGLAPSPTAPGTPDERLDEWLGSLPTTKPSRPELEVHPTKLVVRANPGGGVTRRKLQVTNTGYRLLRSSARVEPADATWLKIPSQYAGKPFVSVETTDLPIEITFPDVLIKPISAQVVVDSNGGQQRVTVTLDLPAAKEAVPDFAASTTGSQWGLGDWVGGQSVPVRVTTWGTALLAARALVMVGDMLSPRLGLAFADAGASPGLAGAAVLLAILGMIGGAILALKRGSAVDVPSAGFAGAFAGVLAAALVVAACRSVEPVLGSFVARSPLVLGVWFVIGAAAAGLSSLLVPPTTRPEVSP